MRVSQAWIIARHDIGIFRHKRGIMGGLIGLPLGIGIGFPLLVAYLVSTNSGTGFDAYLPQLINAFSFWFVIGAGSLPTAIAAYGIVGEKVERSLEPLLSTPTTDGEILLGKSLAAFIPTILSLWGGALLFQVLIDWETRATFGYLYYPNWEMTVILFVLAPLVCLYAIELCVLISSRVTDARSAQQYAGVIFVPLLFVYIGGEVGFALNTTHLLYIAAIFAVLVLAFFEISRRTFHREEILTRWK